MKDYVSEISSYLPDTISSDTDYSKVAYGKAYRTETLDDSMVDSGQVELEKKRQEKLQQAQQKKLSLTNEDLSKFTSTRSQDYKDGYVEVNKNNLDPSSTRIAGVSSGYYPKELVDQYMAPSNSADSSQSDDLSNKLVEARLEDRGFIGDAVATVKGLAANVGRGAVNLGQSAGELITLPFQETYNAVTGKNEDWNIYSDDTAKNISKGIDKVIGYDREVDELAAKRVEDSFKKAGVDILDPSTYKNAANIEGFGKQLLDVIPAAVSGFGDLIGGGVALGAGSKLVIKGLEKAVPSLGSKVDEFTTLNKTRAIEEVKDLKAKAAAGTIDNIKYKDGMLAIEIDYNLGKKIPDLIKGNSMSNAYFLTQMDENLEKFKENNGGVSATPEEMLRIATITKFMAELQASAAGKVLGVGELDTAVKAASQSAIKSVLDPVASTLGKGTYEAIQEGLDQAAIEVNQKYGTKAYEGKSVTDIISDSSAEIITGMVLGGVGGGTVTGGREAVSGITDTGISEALGSAVDKIGKGVQGNQEQKPYAFDNFTDEAEKQKAKDYISVLGSLENTDKSNPSPYTTLETIHDTVDKLYEIRANREAVVKLPPEYLAKVDMAYESIIDDIQKAIETNPEIKLSKPVPVDQNAMGTNRTARVIDSSEESQRAAKVVELLVDGRSVSEEFLGKLRTTAAYNGIDSGTFEELVGKYRTVEDEATIGYRGYESYVAKGDVDSMQSMLGSTIASKSKLLAGIEAANRKVEELNKSQPDGGKQVLVYSDYNKLDGNKFDIPVKFDGEKWVADTAQATRLIKQKDRTIKGINAGLKALGIKVGDTEVGTLSQIATVDQKTDKAKSTKVVVDSKQTGLERALTNPTHLNKKPNDKDYPITYTNEATGKTVEYGNVEKAYQALKDKTEGTTKPSKEKSKNYALMVDLIATKLSTYPELVEGINEKGGIDYLNSIVHQPTSQNTVWETGGQDWFVSALKDAYTRVSGSAKSEITKEVRYLSGLTEEDLANAAKGEELDYGSMFDSLMGEEQAETIDWTALEQEIVGKEAQDSSYSGIIESMDQILQERVKKVIENALGLDQSKLLATELLNKVIEGCK
jgi:hypothetical protein